MIIPSADEIVIIILRDLILSIGAYETVNQTTSITDETSAQVLEYISY